MSETDIQTSHWPPRPANEVFPDLLDTVLVAQLLLYDHRGHTVEQGRRAVRKLVKDAGLPTLGRIGSTLMLNKTAILTWLANREVDTGDRGSKNDRDDNVGPC